MAAHRKLMEPPRRGFFSFVIEQLVDEDTNGLEWSVMTSECRSMAKWKILGQEVKRKVDCIMDDEEAEGYSQANVRQGIVSRYSSSSSLSNASSPKRITICKLSDSSKIVQIVAKKRRASGLSKPPAVIQIEESENSSEQSLNAPEDCYPDDDQREVSSARSDSPLLTPGTYPSSPGRPPGVSHKQPLGSNDRIEDSISIDNNSSPIIEIEPMEIEAIAVTGRGGKRPVFDLDDSDEILELKKPRSADADKAPNQVLSTSTVDSTRVCHLPTQVASSEEPESSFLIESPINYSRPLIRIDLKGGLIMYKSVLDTDAAFGLETAAQLFPMYSVNAIIKPPCCLAPADSISQQFLQLAHANANDLMCFIRRRRITWELFSEVFMLHHASESFYLCLDIVAAKLFRNAVRRRLKPPTMKDKDILVAPACVECSSFIAVPKDGVETTYPFCLFCDKQYRDVDDQDDAITAIDYPSILQPYAPGGVYDPTENEQKTAEMWLLAARQYPGPVLSFLFSVLAMLPPGWGGTMISIVDSAKLCGHCGLGTIVGHSWFDQYRCTWCMGLRTVHVRNSKNRDMLLYHVEQALKMFKTLEVETICKPKLGCGNIEETLAQDEEPYLTPISTPLEARVSPSTNELLSCHYSFEKSLSEWKATSIHSTHDIERVEETSAASPHPEGAEGTSSFPITPANDSSARIAVSSETPFNPVLIANSLELDYGEAGDP